MAASSTQSKQQVSLTQVSLSNPWVLRLLQQLSNTLGIIATNDFFVQVAGQGNVGARGVDGKLYGYRAQASC